MPGERVVVLGRAGDCDVVLEDASVSSRHARLRWDGAAVVVEDLGSANGVFVGGRRVRSARVRPGDDVQLGGAALPWSDPRLGAFLRAGSSGATVVATWSGRAYVCGRCGARGFLPRGIRRAEVACAKCGVLLELGAARRRGPLPTILGAALVVLLLGAAYVARDSLRQVVQSLGKEAGVATAIPIADWQSPAESDQESAIRASGTRDRVIAAIDPTAPATRDLAVRLAATDDGPFHVGQVAAIWAHVRERWSYVNDPHTSEYFARASETVGNGFVGDCDDFAILLVALIEAIGGDARVVMSDGERGGHAYAEACIQADPQRVAADLRAHYRRERDRTRVRDVHFRSDATCPVWLDLDWSAQTPGGPYGQEAWAVAIHPDGKTETLAPATGR